MTNALFFVLGLLSGLTVLSIVVIQRRKVQWWHFTLIWSETNQQVSRLSKSLGEVFKVYDEANRVIYVDHAANTIQSLKRQIKLALADSGWLAWLSGEIAKEHKIRAEIVAEGLTESERNRLVKTMITELSKEHALLNGKTDSITKDLASKIEIIGKETELADSRKADNHRYTKDDNLDGKHTTGLANFKL